MKPQLHKMSDAETRRLRMYQIAKRYAFHPAVRVTSRRSSKNPSTGKVYANSRVIPGVSLERVFNKPNWTKYANDLLARK